MLSRIFRDDFENKKANRKRQIDTLKVFNDNVTEIIEDVEYKVDFMSGDTLMYIQVTLPPDFPYECPKLKVHPPIIHTWVKNNMDIDNAPGLLNFTIHSDLGRVVQVIAREFQIRPPVICGDNINIQHDVQQVTSVPAAAVTRYNMIPPHSDKFPELNNMSVEELEELDKDEDVFEDFVFNMKQSCDINLSVDDFIVNNEKLAQDNIDRQGQLEDIRTKVTNKFAEFQSLKSKFDEKNKDCERLSKQFEPQNIRELLRQAAAKSDEESEVIADQFLNKQIDVEQFLNDYLDKRKLSHTRKSKEEKLSNQLKELQRAGY